MRASPALRPVQQLVVGENQRHHRLDDRGAADTDAGVVTTLGHDIGRLARLVDRRHGGQDRARRLEATRTTTGWPVEMPPAMPPALFDRKSGRLLPPTAGRIASAFSSPRSRAA